jgi:hypothetical protein
MNQKFWVELKPHSGMGAGSITLHLTYSQAYVYLVGDFDVTPRTARDILNDVIAKKTERQLHGLSYLTATISLDQS